jgi:hypothetical protein
MSDMKMYDILGKFKNLDPQFKPLDQVEQAKEPVYQEVEPRGSITQAVNKLQESFAEFKEAALPKYNYPDVKQQRQVQAANDNTSAPEDLTKSADPELAQLAQQARFAKPKAKSDIEAIAGVAATLKKELERAKAAEEEDRQMLIKNQEVIGQTNDRFKELNAKVASGDITAQDVELAKAAQEIEKDADAAKAAVTAEPTAAVKQIKTPIVNAPKAKGTVTAKAPQQTTAPTTPAPAAPKPVPKAAVHDIRTGQEIDPELAAAGDLFGLDGEDELEPTGTLGEAVQVNYPVGDARLGQFNMQKIVTAFKNRLPEVDLIFGDQAVKLKYQDIEAIIRYMTVKSKADMGIVQNLASKNLNTVDNTQRLLRSTAIDQFRKRVRVRPVPKDPATAQLDFTKKAETPAATQVPVAQPKQVQQPKKGQIDLFNGNDNMKDINTLTKTLEEAFMSFKEDAKPDFLDLDKDGDTEEPMKKAAKDAKDEEPAKIDKDAVAKRKRLQALKDKQEDERAERGDDDKSSSRFVKGRAYGGAAQKDAEDKDDLDEVSYSAKAARAGKDIGKPGKAFAKIAKSAGERYGSKERGEKVAGAVLNKLRHGEELDESGLQYYTGKKKYGKEGMTALAKAGRDGASEEELGRIKYKYKKEDVELNEKAVSKQQQKFMGMVHAVQKGKMKAPSKEIAKTAKGMTKKAAHDFAATKHKGLPTKVAEGKEAIRQHPIYTDKDAWDHYKKELDEQEVMDGVRDVQQELDEIAKLAGVPVACPKCSCAPCKCEESIMDAELPSVNVETPLSHELSNTNCVVCNESPCSCTEQKIEEAVSRKDFRQAADTIKDIEDLEKRKEHAHHYADFFKKQNPRFKREMFLAACGLEECDWNMNPTLEPVMGEGEMDEGNEFSGALAKAKAAGAKEFEVDGKKYTVKEDINLNVSAVGEEDVVNLIRKLSGMATKEAPQITGVAIPVEDETCSTCGSADCGCEAVAEDGPNIKNAEPRDNEVLNTPREQVAAADITTKTGTGLNRSKKQYRGEYPGDNPMDAYGRNGTQVKEELWQQYEDMLSEITK